ncbi:MAG TPA: lactonase family protein [Actinophytocola sp.]|uniref:lactonase family protein n=1 Tax=Actinophytocola sp. TaxID=1872138 RepID=UPI002DBA8B35|nr:lactonase family protein [Actinophytocola sp.]HEU5476030.1 lactonase family protein [Actinophytocola sp.]
MYVGSFPADRGLAVGRVDPDTAELRMTGTVADVPDVSFLAFAQNRQVLYATSEQEPDGSVTALNIADPERPEVLGRQPTKGAAPTHLSVHTSGRFLLTANYGSGTVVVHPLEPSGEIGAASDLATLGGHAHQVLTDPSGRWVLAADLGTDTVHVLRLDLSDGSLAPRSRLGLPDGSGPRHVAFHPFGRHVYILGERRPEITVAAWDPAGGRLDPGQVVPIAAPGETFPAEILACRDGRFLYVSNRGANTILVFAVHDAGARLVPAGTAPTGGDWPRHCTLSPDEQWIYVANQHSGTVTRLPRDPSTGGLGAAGDPVPVTNPAVILFH